MITALWLLIVQGALGALDTLRYHEWKVALHSRAGASRELVLHSSRNFCYATLYALVGVAWGAMLPFLLPEVWRWLHEPLAFVPVERGGFALAMGVMALGAAGFGLRDGYYARRQFDKVAAP